MAPTAARADAVVPMAIELWKSKKERERRYAGVVYVVSLRMACRRRGRAGTDARVEEP